MIGREKMSTKRKAASSSGSGIDSGFFEGATARSSGAAGSGGGAGEKRFKAGTSASARGTRSRGSDDDDDETSGVMGARMDPLLTGLGGGDDSDSDDGGKDSKGNHIISL
jgi:hypothetical protein